MSFRFRKSVRIAKGVRVNFSKRGIGMSVGTKGLRFGVGPSGKRVTTSIPGTGIYYEKRIGSGRSKRRKSTSSHTTNINNPTTNDAVAEVELFELELEELTSLHKDCSKGINWEEKESSSPPFTPDSLGPNEESAREKLKNYKPTWRDKLFNRIEARKRILQDEVQEAKKQDEQLYQEWKEQKELAQKILNGDLQAYLKVISDYVQTSLGNINYIGRSIEFNMHDEKTVEATLFVHSEEIIPSKSKSLTKTGKVSTRNMAKGKFYELYQNHICSCVLRVARELFAYLPIEKVFINASANILDTATGNENEQIILSVKITKESSEFINFEMINPSDTIEQFENNMKFRKTKGFAPVEKLQVD